MDDLGVVQEPLRKSPGKSLLGLNADREHDAIITLNKFSIDQSKICFKNAEYSKPQIPIAIGSRETRASSMLHRQQ